MPIDKDKFDDIAKTIDKLENDLRDLFSYGDLTAAEIELTLSLYQMKTLLGTKPQTMFKYIRSDSPLFNIMLSLDMVLNKTFDKYFQEISKKCHQARGKKNAN